MSIPVKFAERLTAGSGNGYPTKISASDLDRNFAYAALEVSEGLVEKISVGEHQGRRLNIKEVEVLVCENNSPKSYKFLAKKE